MPPDTHRSCGLCCPIFFPQAKVLGFRKRMGKRGRGLIKAVIGPHLCRAHTALAWKCQYFLAAVSPRGGRDKNTIEIIVQIPTGTDHWHSAATIPLSLKKNYESTINHGHIASVIARSPHWHINVIMIEHAVRVGRLSHTGA